MQVTAQHDANGADNKRSFLHVTILYTVPAAGLVILVTASLVEVHPLIRASTFISSILV
jgi:hypothetical protein